MLFPEFNIKYSFLTDENTGANKMQYLSQVVHSHGKDDHGQHRIEHAVPWTGLGDITHHSCVGLTSLWELNRKADG